MKRFLPIIPIVLLLCGAVSALEYSTNPERQLEAINRVNPDSELDRADTVRVSLSQGRMMWRDRVWAVKGSVHTPIGRFRLSGVDSGASWNIPESAFVIPFSALKRSDIPRTHPYYTIINQRKEPGTVFGIHKNNLRPGKVGAGCLLVSDSDLLEMSQTIPGATIVISR
jgi:hypothetical protein